MRHTLRSPYAHTSGAAFGLPTNGLSAGTAYGLSPSARSTSMRTTVPSSVAGFWPWLCGSFAAPPSPTLR
jgi:hypothetical protein